MPNCTDCNRYVASESVHPCGESPLCRSCAERDRVCEDCGRTRTRYYMRSDDGDVLCGDCHTARTTWQAKRLNGDTTYENLTSRRRFGIELETSACPNYRSLKDQTLFGAKFDCSVQGMEFVSPILFGDAGLKEVEDICAHAARLDFKVDGDCGYHLHVDMSETTLTQRRRVAYAYLLTYPLWISFVNSFRAHDCTYCTAPRTGADMVRTCEDLDYELAGTSRYAFINLSAYDKHRTFEIRGYEGTLDYDEIATWIQAHLQFVDYVAELDFDTIDDLFSCAGAWENLLDILPDGVAQLHGFRPVEVTV